MRHKHPSFAGITAKHEWFDEIEVHGLAEGEPVYDSAIDPTSWAVFGHYSAEVPRGERGLETFAEFPTMIEAQWYAQKGESWLRTGDWPDDADVIPIVVEVEEGVVRRVAVQGAEADVVVIDLDLLIASGKPLPDLPGRFLFDKRGNLTCKRAWNAYTDFR